MTTFLTATTTAACRVVTIGFGVASQRTNGTLAGVALVCVGFGAVGVGVTALRRVGVLSRLRQWMVALIQDQPPPGVRRPDR